MLKKGKKWIAIFVILTFVWLLQASGTPLAAAGANEQVGSTKSEQGPACFEAVSRPNSQVKKKSVLPFALIGVGVIAAAAIFFLAVTKTGSKGNEGIKGNGLPEYDITGWWCFDLNNRGAHQEAILVFSGTKTSGSFSWDGVPERGTYTVNGKNVDFVFSDNPPNCSFNGQFTGENIMEGDMVFFSSWTIWNAVRHAGGIWR
jgi:hypothetical protein